ncbi:MAG: helix-turn-helix domain-containing protein [Alphaproteobacteria bacterium]
MARAAFAAEGYAAAGTNALVDRAGLTRGALYYQFRDKRDLFRAVFVEAQKEIAAEIERAAAAAADPWTALVAGCKTFIATSARADIRRIVLIDGPAVLGWAEWRKIDAEHGMGLLLAGLEECARAGHLHEAPLLPLAHLISGALNEAALVLAERPDDIAAGRAMAQAVDRLLGGLRRPRA